MKKDFTKPDFVNMLKPNGECLEWTKHVETTGYGRTWALGKQWSTHRLALELEGISTTGHCVLHSCDNRLCCNPAHLRLGTQQENMQDMVSKGRQLSGSSNANAKLTEQDVREIRAIRGMYGKDIAAQYGVHPSLIGRILNRQNWRHI